MKINVEIDLTPEELRREFLDLIRIFRDCWEQEKGKTSKEKLDGLCFSILNIFDGTTMGLPAFDIVASPHEDDKQYCIDCNANWIEPGTVINDCMLHELWHTKP